MTPSRRDFLRASAAGAAAVALPRLAVAIDPIRRPGPKPDLKLGLAAYSFRKFLTGKTPEMTLFDFIDLAAGLPLDGVELTSYYFAATDDGYLDKLKAHAASKKLTISGVPVGNDFAQKDDAKRRGDIDHVKTWTGRAARLGAKTVRVFAGNQPKGDTLADAQKRVVAALEECCPVAEKAGVVLALENHGGITDTAAHLLDLVKPVTSPALGVNIDTGNFKTADPYADLAAIAPYGVNCQVKTEVFPGGKKQPGDLGRMVQVLKDANYHGFVVLEHEADEDPKEAVPRHVRDLRKLIG